MDGCAREYPRRLHLPYPAFRAEHLSCSSTATHAQRATRHRHQPTILFPLPCPHHPPLMPPRPCTNPPISPPSSTTLLPPMQSLLPLAHAHHVPHPTPHLQISVQHNAAHKPVTKNGTPRAEAGDQAKAQKAMSRGRKGIARQVY